MKVIKKFFLILSALRLIPHIVIGANAVVVKDVPSNCTVVGVPTYIVSRDVQRIREKL